MGDIAADKASKEHVLGLFVFRIFIFHEKFAFGCINFFFFFN